MKEFKFIRRAKYFKNSAILFDFSSYIVDKIYLIEYYILNGNA